MTFNASARLLAARPERRCCGRRSSPPRRRPAPSTPERPGFGCQARRRSPPRIQQRSMAPNRWRLWDVPTSRSPTASRRRGVPAACSPALSRLTANGGSVPDRSRPPTSGLPTESARSCSSVTAFPADGGCTTPVRWWVRPGRVRSRTEGDVGRRRHRPRPKRSRRATPDPLRLDRAPTEPAFARPAGER